jgi:hypothetical protein
MEGDLVGRRSGCGAGGGWGAVGRPTSGGLIAYICFGAGQSLE